MSDEHGRSGLFGVQPPAPLWLVCKACMTAPAVWYVEGQDVFVFALHTMRVGDFIVACPKSFRPALTGTLLAQFARRAAHPES